MQQPQPTQPPALAPGTLLASRYFIQGYIGGGGFGHIYKAQDRVLGHRRAIKEAFYRDAQTQQQFRLEAEFLLNARHPNLVRGYAVFEQAGRFYLVMDYVDGQTLEEIAIQHIRTTGRPLREAQVLDWILPICDAVHALHQQPTPIIHRDVKPANIKLTRTGAPTLIDLGLAKLFSAGTNTITAALAFTPGYAPPEQYQASGATDQRTDVYGLGATLFYLLTGYQPTEAPARLGAHALPAPRTLNPAISVRTEQIVLTAMALDPKERYQSAGALLGELHAARAALPAPTRPRTATDAALSPQLRPCVRCGTANPPAARFCMRCGQPIADSKVTRASSGLRLVAPPPPDADTPAGAPPPPATHSRWRRAIQAAAAYARATGQGDAPFARHAPKGAPPTPPGRPASRQVALVQVAPPEEAQSAIATVLAMVCLSLSAIAILAPLTHRAGWALIFSVPAIALAHWSLQHQRTDTPLTLRRLTFATLVLGYGWPIIWLLVFMLAAR